MNSIFKVVRLSCILLVSVFVFSLNAQQLNSRGPIPFSVYDSNKDGVVTQKEFYDMRAKRIEQKVNQGMPMRNVGNAPSFEEFDSNNDGKLTELELIKGQNAQMQKRRSNKGFGQGQGRKQGMGPGMGQGQGMN